MITAFHGIGAYRGQTNPLALRSALVQCMATQGEVCIADRPIGAFGAVFGGRVSYVFDRDVWSEVGTEGMRFTESDDVEACQPLEQDDFESFCKTAIRPHNQRHYCEAWMTVDCVRALWVKGWADSATVKSAKIMARARRLPLLTVTGQSRIWGVLENNNIPVYVSVGE